ncbi:MAG: thermonuclease family protein [Polyangiaceae bacterium]
MSTTGMLEVRGSISFEQFWPMGTSDADTTKIVVEVPRDGFRYRTPGASRFRVTDDFHRVVVIGRAGRREPVRDGKVTIRLQGIDAPELHYRPPSALARAARTAQQHAAYLACNHEYRQPLAETGTVSLSALLAGTRRTTVPCVVRTLVGEPGDVFDTYGRLVGDVWIDMSGREVDLNHWLVEHGWAVPAFYSSMTAEEIDTLRQLAATAARGRRGVWRHLDGSGARFDWRRRYRGRGATFSPAADTGNILLPKLFRRQCTWAVNRRSRMVRGTFAEYLAERPEGCYLTDEFLEQGVEASSHHRLSDFVTSRGEFELRPPELVFQEAAATLRRLDGGAPRW